MAAFVKVANTDDLQPGQTKLVTAGDQRVALFNVSGTCYAINDTCTHQGGPLSVGAHVKVHKSERVSWRRCGLWVLQGF